VALHINADICQQERRVLKVHASLLSLQLAWCCPHMG